MTQLVTTTDYGPLLLGQIVRQDAATVDIEWRPNHLDVGMSINLPASRLTTPGWRVGIDPLRMDDWHSCRFRGAPQPWSQCDRFSPPEGGQDFGTCAGSADCTPRVGECPRWDHLGNVECPTCGAPDTQWRDQETGAVTCTECLLIDAHYGE